MNAETVAAIVVLTVAYFTPAVLAWGRHVAKWDAVAVVNILTGWTVIGWVVAFVMAARMAPRITAH